MTSCQRMRRPQAEVTRLLQKQGGRWTFLASEDQRELLEGPVSVEVMFAPIYLVRRVQAARSLFNG